MIIYLYVKTHNKTDLKYLGKTIAKNPHKYRGSGDYWKRHIKEHGYDVHTEILRECQSDEEVRQWGLYYSELWDVVKERDEHGKKTWANLMEEAGDGFTSEQARQSNLTRVEDGTHQFLDSEFQRQINLRRVEDRTHNFLGGEIQKQMAQKRIADGTHHFLDGEIARRRVADGTHNLLGGEIARRRVADGTHHFLGGEIQKQMAQKRVENGTHNFLNPTSWRCPHCGKTGKGTGLFTRWHGAKCKSKFR